LALVFDARILTLAIQQLGEVPDIDHNPVAALVNGNWEGSHRDLVIVVFYLKPSTSHASSM
jgi:hypothetical protein